MCMYVCMYSVCMYVRSGSSDTVFTVHIDCSASLSGPIVVAKGSAVCDFSPLKSVRPATITIKIRPLMICYIEQINGDSR